MPRSQLCHLLKATLCAFILTGAWVAGAMAQDGPDAEPEFAQPSDEQLSLNDDAVRAIIEGDYAGAVARLEEARSLGELNVTYLNLGRAYQKLGNCDQAYDAFGRALEAPRVRQPSAAFVQRKVDEYRAQLDEQCPARDRAEAAESTAEEPEDVRANGEREQAADGAEAKPAAKTTPPPAAKQSSALAWTVTLGGLAVMAGGGAMFGLAAAERDKVRSQPEPGQGIVTERTMKDAADIESRANTYDTVGVAALAGGAIITGVGAYLFVSADSDTSDSTATVEVGADRVQLQWRVLF